MLIASSTPNRSSCKAVLQYGDHELCPQSTVRGLVFTHPPGRLRRHVTLCVRGRIKYGRSEQLSSQLVTRSLGGTAFRNSFSAFGAHLSSEAGCAICSSQIACASSL